MFFRDHPFNGAGLDGHLLLLWPLEALKRMGNTSET